MKEKVKTLNFANIHVTKVHEFLDRFNQFDENLLLELTENELYAKTYTPDRSAIKYSSLPFEEVLQLKDDVVLPDLLKIGLINIKQYQHALKFLDSSEQVSLGIDYLNLAGLDVEEESVATKTCLNNNKNLQFSFGNGSLSIYGTITNEKFFNEIANIEEPIFEFDLELEELLKIKKFAAIDKIANDINVTCDKNGDIYFENQNFKYKIDSQNTTDSESTKAHNTARFPKSYLNMLDGESYKVSVGGNRLVFVSTDSKTYLVVGRNDKS